MSVYRDQTDRDGDLFPREVKSQKRHWRPYGVQSHRRIVCHADNSSRLDRQVAKLCTVQNLFT
jgi:hypothetical protein